MSQLETAPHSSRFLIWLSVAFWGFALWSWSLSWSDSILDRHEFRQVQTAVSAHWLVETGWKLDYETPLFGPPWSIPMEFPLYQTCVAALTWGTNIPLESAGRATSIFFLIMTMPAVYLLAGIFGLSPSRRLFVISIVLTSPVLLYYARTIMIETSALCFASWFLVATGLAARDKSVPWALIATLSGILAARAKITTFAAFCFPAGGLTIWLAWPQLFGRKRNLVNWLHLSVLCAVPVLLSVWVGSWWVTHADSVKASNPYSGFLVSSQMTP